MLGLRVILVTIMLVFKRKQLLKNIKTQNSFMKLNNNVGIAQNQGK